MQISPTELRKIIRDTERETEQKIRTLYEKEKIAESLNAEKSKKHVLISEITYDFEDCNEDYTTFNLLSFSYCVIMGSNHNHESPLMKFLSRLTEHIQSLNTNLITMNYDPCGMVYEWVESIDHDIDIPICRVKNIRDRVFASIEL